MNSVRPVVFCGTFSNLATYSMTMNAARQPYGIASEVLDALQQHVLRDFKGVETEVKAYEYPATLRITGNQADVKAADQFVRNTFDQQGVTYTYTEAG